VSVIIAVLSAIGFVIGEKRCLPLAFAQYAKRQPMVMNTRKDT
jgi:hypothetical protein